MPKLTQLDKAIAGLDAEIAVLQAAKQRLITQQQATTKKKAIAKPRVVVGPAPLQERPA